MSDTPKKLKNTTLNSSPLSDMIKTILSSSIGRLPASLVILLMAALSLSLITGLIMHLAQPHVSTEDAFLPMRLEQSVDAPPFDNRVLQGLWVTQSPTYAMSFFVEGNKFEWIVRLRSTGDTQFFARGNFRTEGDVIILGQRPDMGIPFDPDKPWIVNMPMAITNINIIIRQDNPRHLQWAIPASEQSRILSHTQEIFLKNTDGIFEWKKQ